MKRESAHKYLYRVYNTTKNDSYREALSVALSALRPVSREQVEKVWRGCDLCLDDSWERRLMIPKRFDHATFLSGELALFCPGCGRPLTDEAVEMVMERLEGLYGEAKAN